MNGNEKHDLTTLFVDLDAYFATAEQHFQPELRGKPVGVTPVLNDSSCCIAVSYEARPFGIKTGTLVRDARRLCPGIIIVHARPRRYVELHHEVLEAAETVLPIHKVCSIDEFACKLIGTEREAHNALQLAANIKLAVAARCGTTLSCSIGISTNHLLAKLASDMRKPNGTVLLSSSDIPNALFDLELTDFCGIGKRMCQRFATVGVHTVEQMYALNEQQVHDVYGGVVGREWYHLIRGIDIHRPAQTQRRSLSHEHVLPPELRSKEEARRVVVRLLTKAAARLRKEEYWAGRLTICVRFVDGGKWKKQSKLPPTQDTRAFLNAFCAHWETLPEHSAPKMVGVVLTDLCNDVSAAAPLFAGEHEDLSLSLAMDKINKRYGYDAIYPASMHAAKKTAPMRIAFNHIPDLDQPDFES